MLIMRETEEDSDPEFNSGVFIPEPTKKRRKKSEVAHAGRKRKRTSEFIKQTNPTREPKGGQRGARFKRGITALGVLRLCGPAERQAIEPNPLAKWFGKWFLPFDDP